MKDLPERESYQEYLDRLEAEQQEIDYEENYDRFSAEIDDYRNFEE